MGNEQGNEPEREPSPTARLDRKQRMDSGARGCIYTCVQTVGWFGFRVQYAHAIGRRRQQRE